MYDIRLEKRHKIIKKKVRKKINIKEIFLWYLGMVVSLIPLLMDVVVYISDCDGIWRDYWEKVCLQGDLLWIMSTIMIITLIEYISQKEESKNFKAYFAMILVPMVMIAFGLWMAFRYVYSVDYNGSFPLTVTAIVVAGTLLFCSPIHVKEVEK